MFPQLLLLFLPAITSAQEPGSRAEEQASQQEAKARNLTPPPSSLIEQRLLRVENAGGFGSARGFVVKFGDIKRGSGFAPGVGYGYTTASGAVFAGKGVYSIKNYKLLQASAQSPAFSEGRLLFRARARWQDAPTVALYPIGTNPSAFRTDYAETKTEVSGEALLKPLSFVRLGGGVGLEQFNTGFPHNENPVGLPLLDSFPGAGADPDYVHSRAFAADWIGGTAKATRAAAACCARRSTTITKTAAGRSRSRRLDGAAEQYLPILHGNWVLFLGLWASTTMTAAGQRCPVFPDAGSGRSRPSGFSDYRFRDRHSINWTAEYRWYAQEFLDAAIFYDAGKTAATRSALDFTGLHSSIGAGVRLHTPLQTLVRVELAHSHEGMRFLIGFSPVGQ